MILIITAVSWKSLFEDEIIFVWKENRGYALFMHIFEFKIFRDCLILMKAKKKLLKSRNSKLSKLLLIRWGIIVIKIVDIEEFVKLKVTICNDILVCHRNVCLVNKICFWQSLDPHIFADPDLDPYLAIQYVVDPTYPVPGPKHW